MHLGLTRKFLLFFILTAVLPILVISIIFFQTVEKKLDDRITIHLHYGLHVAQELFEQDIRKLEVLSSEAAFLSVNEKYQHYLNTGEYGPLDQLLNRYQASKKLDIVSLLTARQTVVASTENAQDVHMPSYQAIIRKALRGKAANSTESFEDPDNHEIQLTYVTASPVFAAQSPRHVIAVLVTGQYIGEKSSLQRLPEIIPGLQARLLTLKPSGSQVTLSTFPGRPPSDALPTAVDPEDARQQPFDEDVNNHAYRSYGARITDFLGNPVGFLIVSDSKADVEDLLRRDFVYLGLYLLLALAMVALSGTWFKRTFIDPVVALSNASQQVAEGNFNVRVTLHSAQKELNDTVQRFNRMLAQLQENEQLRHNFVSTLTHDLRTPLVAQKRALELFEARKDTLLPKLAGLAHDLLQSNDQLLAMVNTLLETYQYEAGRIRLNPEWVDLTRLVQDCFTALQPSAEHRDMQLVNEIPADFPALWADPYQLQRVLTNLVGNALENSPPGCQVRILAQVNGAFKQLEVSDNGPGIPPEILPGVFERYGANLHGQRHKIGSGLGLYICKMILVLHGGTIQVQSKPHEGTRFIMTFPNQEEDA